MIKDREALRQLHVFLTKQEGHFESSGLGYEEQEAMEYVRDIKGFYANLASYLVVITGLLILNLLTSPGYFWVIWPALGWGIGIVTHGLSVFEIFSPLGANWEQRQIKKRLRRK